MEPTMEPANVPDSLESKPSVDETHLPPNLARSSLTAALGQAWGHAAHGAAEALGTAANALAYGAQVVATHALDLTRPSLDAAAATRLDWRTANLLEEVSALLSGGA